MNFSPTRWAESSASQALKKELVGTNGPVLNALLANQNSFQIVDESTSSSLYTTRIYTTFPEVAFKAKLRKDAVEEGGSGFVYSLKESWRSIKEIPNDVVDDYKARGDKSFDSTYDFINHGTFGGLDAIWLGSKDRLAKKSDSPADFFNYVTAGISGAIAGTVIGTVNPKEPFSKEHWLDSFGLATVGVGGGRVARPKPAGGLNGSSVEKNTVNNIEGVKVTSKYADTSNYKYNMIENPGPLADMKNTPNSNFYGGKYNLKTLESDTIYYRAGEKGKPLGQWFTTMPAESVAKVSVDLAVKEQWINPKSGVLEGKSIIDTSYAIKIPKGTIVYEGPVGYQGAGYLGGMDISQTFVKEPWNISGIEVVESKPLK